MAQVMKTAIILFHDTLGTRNYITNYVRNDNSNRVSLRTSIDPEKALPFAGTTKAHEFIARFDSPLIELKMETALVPEDWFSIAATWMKEYDLHDHKTDTPAFLLAIARFTMYAFKRHQTIKDQQC